MSLDARLKQLASDTGLSFAVLAARWDAGYRGAKLTASAQLPADNKWVTTAEAAKLMIAAPSSLLQNKALLERSVERRSRSSAGRGPQGVGYLWLRADCERVRFMRLELKLTVRNALRVMAARKEGRL